MSNNKSQADLRAEVARLEESESQLLAERDGAEEWADRLANAIALGAQGEHASCHNPWAEAEEIADGLHARLTALTAERDRLAAEVERLRRVLEETAIGIDVLRGGYAVEARVAWFNIAERCRKAAHPRTPTDEET